MSYTKETCEGSDYAEHSCRKLCGGLCNGKLTNISGVFHLMLHVLLYLVLCDLFICNYNYILSETLGVRLVGGSNDLEGTVEVKYNGTWGTICSNVKWNILAADVVCKTLGYKRAVASPRDGHFGSGSGPNILSNVYCKGTENNIGHCNHDGYGKISSTCWGHEVAGVVCSSGTFL